MSAKANRYILSIDPSISDLGFAIITYEGMVVQSGMVTQHNQRHNYPSRALSISRELQSVVSSFRHPIAHAVIEMPEKWVSYRATAAMDSEAVQKLYYTVGSIVFALCARSCQVWYVTPKKWKGQVPKKLMVKRDKRCNNAQNITVSKMTDHEAEAVLLGKFAYEHIQYDRNSLLRFQAPIEEIKEGHCVTKMG